MVEIDLNCKTFVISMQWRPSLCFRSFDYYFIFFFISYCIAPCVWSSASMLSECQRLSSWYDCVLHSHVRNVSGSRRYEIQASSAKEWGKDGLLPLLEPDSELWFLRTKFMVGSILISLLSCYASASKCDTTFITLYDMLPPPPTSATFCHCFSPHLVVTCTQHSQTTNPWSS